MSEVLPPVPALTAESRGVILDGKAVAEASRARLAGEVERFVARVRRRPCLVAVLVGDDPASHIYVGNKTRSCEELGMLGRTELLANDTSQASLHALLERLDADPAVDGILVQMPLPPGLSAGAAQLHVAPEKDVDGLHPTNVGRLWLGQDGLVPATPSGIIELLESYGFAFRGAHAVVVGRSDIVGKPMAALLLARHCTVTICHSRTRNLDEVCRQADLLVAAVGIPALIGPRAVREGAVVVDVGTNRVEDPELVARLYPDNERKRAALARRGSVQVGDVAFTEVRKKAAAITPVPRGVGPLTIAHVLRNTLRCACRREGFDIEQLQQPG